MEKTLIGTFAILTFSAVAAEIYYEDGSYVNVPDGWVDVSPQGPVNCQDVPDDPRCGQGYIEWEYVPPTYTVHPSKYRRQQDVFLYNVTSGSE